MKVLPDLREPQHGRIHATCQNIEGDEFANRQRAINDQLRAEIEDASGDDLADELHDLASRIAEAQNAETGSYVTGKLLFPPSLHLRFDGHGLERLDTRDALDKESLVLGAALEFLIEAPSKQWRRSH